MPKSVSTKDNRTGTEDRVYAQPGLSGRGDLKEKVAVGRYPVRRPTQPLP